MRFYCLYILFFCCVLTYNLTAQSNFKQKQIVVKSDTVFLDSLSLIPGSIKLKLKEYRKKEELGTILQQQEKKVLLQKPLSIILLTIHLREKTKD